MDYKHKNARILRNNATIEERRIWNIIKNKNIQGLKFRRQFPIGNYIVDFVCLDIKLVIEIDGGQHNQNEDVEYDKKRTKYLESQGYTVIRLWNNEVYQNIEGVCDKIERIVAQLTPPQL